MGQRRRRNFNINIPIQRKTVHGPQTVRQTARRRRRLHSSAILRRSPTNITGETRRHCCCCFYTTTTDQRRWNNTHNNRNGRRRPSQKLLGGTSSKGTTFVYFVFKKSKVGDHIGLALLLADTDTDHPYIKHRVAFSVRQSWPSLVLDTILDGVALSWSGLFDYLMQQAQSNDTKEETWAKYLIEHNPAIHFAYIGRIYACLAQHGDVNFSEIDPVKISKIPIYVVLARKESLYTQTAAGHSRPATPQPPPLLQPPPSPPQPSMYLGGGHDPIPALPADKKDTAKQYLADLYHQRGLFRDVDSSLWRNSCDLWKLEPSVKDIELLHHLEQLLPRVHLRVLRIQEDAYGSSTIRRLTRHERPWDGVVVVQPADEHAQATVVCIDASIVPAFVSPTGTAGANYKQIIDHEQRSLKQPAQPAQPARLTRPTPSPPLQRAPVTSAASDDASSTQSKFKRQFVPSGPMEVPQGSPWKSRVTDTETP